MLGMFFETHCIYIYGFCLYTIEAIADDVKRLIPVIVFNLYFLLLYLVTITSDSNDTCMNCPDVTLRCAENHLCQLVISLSTCDVFLRSFLSLYCIHRLYLHCVHVRLLRMTLNNNQSSCTL